MKKLNIKSGFPSFPEGDTQEYQGLLTVPGFLCSICNHGFNDRQSLKVHYNRFHIDYVLSSEKPASIFMQHFSNTAGKARSFFPVHLVGSQSSNIDVAAFIKKAREELQGADATVPAEERDYRKVDPWLLTTRWYVHLDNYDPAILCNILELPKKGQDFANLQEAVYALFLKAESFIVYTSDTVKCKLLTTQPKK